MQQLCCVDFGNELSYLILHIFLMTESVSLRINRCRTFTQRTEAETKGWSSI